MISRMSSGPRIYQYLQISKILYFGSVNPLDYEDENSGWIE